MKSPWIFIAALSGGLAVVLGAIGGHGIEPGSRAAELHNTASFYHFTHVFAIFAVGFLAGGREAPARALTLAGSLFAIGTVLFSGSLYISSLTGFSIGGYATPFGGLCLIAGWLALTVEGLRYWRGR